MSQTKIKKLGQVRKGDKFKGVLSGKTAECIGHLPKSGVDVFLLEIVCEDSLHYVYDSYDVWNNLVIIETENETDKI